MVSYWISSIFKSFEGRNIVPYNVKLQLIDADFKYDQSPTVERFATALNELLKTFYVESEFFDMISVDSSSCSQTGTDPYRALFQPFCMSDYTPLKIAAVSPAAGNIDAYKDSVKVAGQVKLDKNYATEPKALFIYSEDIVDPDALSYDKSLIDSKMKNEIVPDVFKQVSNPISSMIS